ncbi:hypothetical protein LRP52_40995 [Photobacterium sp. ZSDE20]|uniref:Helix-turn-helix domain-containing protein n=1 Tax=Photobacterium pectinilyticum TaxID=2906793 RepID=A0ABT1N7S9_9GAMM|nr:hypothetical protein [Photobacterium sp. ZSDE20]MCQ1060814.1 hypothetical protein [Photobacterium sp. ZSDE20]MDD1828562.1 hypothetical protein [Photobacterium sp. ZSDE20]
MNELNTEAVKPLFITRADICKILGMKPTTLDAFIVRTASFPQKKARGRYSRKEFEEWCKNEGLV